MIVLVVSILKEPSEYQYYGMVLGVAAEIFLLIYFFPFFLITPPISDKKTC